MIQLELVNQFVFTQTVELKMIEKDKSVTEWKRGLVLHKRVKLLQSDKL